MCKDGCQMAWHWEMIIPQKHFGTKKDSAFNNDQPYLIHDGEETDTILLSYYGLAEYDEPVFKNDTESALSERNRFFSPVSKGILCEDCTEIRKRVDADGFIWWRPYPRHAKDQAAIQR